MAEFVEIMKIRNRIHKESYEKRKVCIECPLYLLNNGKDVPCSDLREKYPEEYERICLEWAKAHPVQTNADKFEEVFGFRPLKNKCIKKGNCKECEEYGVLPPDCMANWWNKEYKAPTEEVS